MTEFQTDKMYKPIGYSYKVAGNVWAGEYPVWSWNMSDRIRQLQLFIDFGITDFLDLTEYGEMPPYDEFLPSGIHRHTFPIANGMTPNCIESVAGLFRNLETLFKERTDCRLYIHCHGGVGRTGTIVTCYYIWFEHLSFDDALAKMRNRFVNHGRSAWMHAPENQQQLDFIKKFYISDCGTKQTKIWDWIDY